MSDSTPIRLYMGRDCLAALLGIELREVAPLVARFQGTVYREPDPLETLLRD